MSRRRYKPVQDREQRMLLPPSIDEYVGKDNPVRAIDLYVNGLDLAKLGFAHTADKVTPGQPAFAPAALLKLYLYGYLHRVRSSRQLEQECQRNLEVIWLVKGLRPGYKTIADFRKENLKALKAVNRDFLQVCKELKLFGGELVGIDGSFFHGNVAKASIYTAERLNASLQRIDQHIEEYLQALDQIDVEEEKAVGGETEAKLKEKLAALRERQQKQQERLKKLEASGQTQVAEVDEDARLLNKGGQTIAGYNVQVAVDEKHKLIVVGEVVQENNDEHQLEPMAKAAKQELGVESLKATADLGYFNALGIKNCEEAGITPYVPEPDKTNQARLQDRYSREDFSYDPHKNCYRCPAEKELKFSSLVHKNGKTIHLYRSSLPVCAACALRDHCLPKKTKSRSIARWEHEDSLTPYRQRMQQEGSEMMQKRKCLVEHPFGTLKVWCGWTHFLMRGLEKVRAEFSLLTLCYNFKRALSILGMERLRSYFLHRAEMGMVNG